ncbi:MAG: tRNA (adenosine(37)-N6)-threonylcarbamoyltransferase complex dimerization subunit type 1 TsaB [Cytophagales bacterium]|nr:MAG: tRNA (adenosine(37)-N6)-threonylcarbamoyltransferase complex dimerization subunit type 1 TsaB [Cytophagales bacterium]TAF61326.1 MAG: tRNA (adenosine(37)-N6)-threonylcarbamoyltransferase complex dimerization subunit type 1 TsaB [Cytophagales bacterium]
MFSSKMENSPKVILSLDTATEVCSVALHTLEGQLLGESVLYTSKSHASFLMPQIANLYHYTRTERVQTAAVAFGKGPGSYTGLRIGVSTAKGLAQALDVPLLAVDSLAAMTHSVQAMLPFWPENSWFVPMIDARRMEVYMSIYDKHLQEIAPARAQVLEANTFATELAEHHLYFFGNGADKYRSLMTEQAKVVFLSNIHTHARGVGELAIEMYKQQQYADLAYCTAFYLKNFEAGKPKSIEDYFKKK